MFNLLSIRVVLLSSTMAFLPLVASVRIASAQPTTTPSCGFSPPFDSAAFSASTRIDNQWMPLAPGMQFTLEGRSNVDGAPLAHTVILTVTDLTKMIAGVRTVVLWDVDMQDGELAEAELAFHAQDDAGNVWGLGEYPEEYDNSEFAGAPKTWISGLAGARGGLAIMADPRLGTPRYLQAEATQIDFLDCAQAFARDQHTCVPVKCYDHVLIIDETSPLASGRAHQRKYYAPGVGNVQISSIDDPEAETLVLVEQKRLNQDELAQAREEALKLDRRGYEISEVYRDTPPRSSQSHQLWGEPSHAVGVRSYQLCLRVTGRCGPDRCAGSRGRAAHVLRL